MGEQGEEAVGVTCSECGTKIVVMRPEVLTAIGTLFPPGLESELAFIENLKTDKARTGDLVVCDAQHVYACPECGKREQLPSKEELRRSKGD
jgi:DNA-directed RNA polymerase subunit RPC12/RpoP